MELGFTAGRQVRLEFFKACCTDIKILNFFLCWFAKIQHCLSKFIAFLTLFRLTLVYFINGEILQSPMHKIMFWDITVLYLTKFMAFYSNNLHVDKLLKYVAN